MTQSGVEPDVYGVEDTIPIFHMILGVEFEDQEEDYSNGDMIPHTVKQAYSEQSSDP
jgi:hypothetical protein